MFEQATLTYGPVSKRLWTTALGMTGQALLVTSAVLAPMIWPQVLPATRAVAIWLMPPVPATPAKPAAPEPSTPAVVRTVPLQSIGNRVVAPVSIPVHAAVFEEPPLAPSEYRIAGAPVGEMATILRDVLQAVPQPAHMAVPAPAPAQHSAAVIPRVKVGGVVKMARVVSQTRPVYPETARAMRVSGTVELLGVIGTDGRIRELKVQSGNPLLVRAALDAVRQWIYEPTQLNGEPVEVIAPITVTFRLGQ